MRHTGDFLWNGRTLEVWIGPYAVGGNTRVEVREQNGEPYAVISINVPGLEMPDGEFVVHHDATRSAPVLLSTMLEEGVIEDTGKEASYGMVKGQIVCRLGHCYQ